MAKIIVYDNYKLVGSGLESLLSKIPSVSVIGKYEVLPPLISILKSGSEVDLLILSVGQLDAVDLGWIMKVKEVSDVPILVLCENCNPCGVNEAFTIGVNGCIAKEDDVFEIGNAIQRILQGHLYLSTSIGINGLNHCSVIGFPTERIVTVSSRESEILRLIAQGLTNQEIANKIFTSKRTVEAHRHNLISKTGAQNTAELIVKAMRMRLLD